MRDCPRRGWRGDTACPGRAHAWLPMPEPDAKWWSIRPPRQIGARADRSIPGCVEYRRRTSFSVIGRRRVGDRLGRTTTSRLSSSRRYTTRKVPRPGQPTALRARCRRCWRCWRRSRQAIPNSPRRWGRPWQGVRRPSPSLHASPTGRDCIDTASAERAAYCCILGSCVGSAYMGGQPRSTALGRSS